MPTSTSMSTSMFPVFLGLLCFLLAHMTFYMFSYSSLLFSLVVIYSAVFSIQFRKELTIVLLNMKRQFYKNFMKGGFAPFNSSGWSNIVTDEKGNIIDSGNESDEHLSEDENEDFDPTDNMISRRRRRKRSNVKNADDGILVEKTDEPVESIVDNDSNTINDEKSKSV